MQDLIFMSRGIYAKALYNIISIVGIPYYTETIIQIFNRTRIRCYIGIIPRILADSYRVNKREYGLHVFMDIRENYLKNTQKIFFLYSTILSEYGRIRCKKAPYSRWFYAVYIYEF